MRLFSLAKRQIEGRKFSQFFDAFTKLASSNKAGTFSGSICFATQASERERERENKRAYDFEQRIILIFVER